MSCYFRHMKDIFDEVGLEITKENKKTVDRIIHELVDVSYKDCSPTWKAVKTHIKGDGRARSRFVERFKAALRAQV